MAVAKENLPFRSSRPADLLLDPVIVAVAPTHPLLLERQRGTCLYSYMALLSRASSSNPLEQSEMPERKCISGSSPGRFDSLSDICHGEISSCLHTAAVKPFDSSSYCSAARPREAICCTTSAPVPLSCALRCWDRPSS